MVLLFVWQFFNSEIVGDYTDGSWGVVFERLGETMPRVPIQLFEGFLYVLIFIVLITIYIKKIIIHVKGSLIYIFIYDVCWIAFFRILESR